MKEDEHVQTTIRGYNSTNVDLYGKLNGDANSGIKMKQCCVNNQSGVFGTFEDLLGKANEVKGLFDSAKDIYSNITSGNVLGVLQRAASASPSRDATSWASTTAVDRVASTATRAT